MRFWQRTVAVSDNIEAVFMQIKVKAEDQPFLRFLWTKKEQLITYQNASLLFGATDSPCVVCYAVQSFEAEHARSRIEIQRIITQDIYVDNLLATFDTVDAATNVVEELRNTLVLRGV